MQLVRTLATLAGVVISLAPALASANPWDISLRGLGRPSLDPAAFERYHLLSSEIALAMSPKAMQPAETLGISGFEISLANTLTNISQGADYWQGQPGMPIMEGPVRGRSVPGMLWTPTVHVRKGLPFSTEVGVQAIYLAQSEMVMLGGETKIAIHESFWRWLPAIAGRAAVGRLMGSSDLDLLTAEGDIMASLPFGIGGMTSVTPYLGYGYLFAHVNSGVLDETPFSVTDDVNDQKGGADGSLYNFDTIDWKDNKLPRIFGGVRVNTAMLELLYELNIGTMHNGKALQSHTLKIGFDV